MLQRSRSLQRSTTPPPGCDCCGVISGDNSTCGGDGDLNVDGELNVLDIVMIVEYIIDETPFTEPQQFVADMNMDGIINILDIMTMVYFILHG